MLKLGLVSPFSSRISDVVPLSLPPNNIVPCGESQALCPVLSLFRLWDWIQVLVLERVWHDVLAA